MRYPLIDRREFLRHNGLGLGGIALASLLAEQKLLADSKGPIRPAIDSAQPYAARSPQFAAKARRGLHDDFPGRA